MFRFLCLSLALCTFASFQVKAADLPSCLDSCKRQIAAIPECKAGESCKQLPLKIMNCPKNCHDTYK